MASDHNSQLRKDERSFTGESLWQGLLGEWNHELMASLY